MGATTGRRARAAQDGREIRARGVEPPAGSPEPGRRARSAGSLAGSRAVARPLQPDGAIAVRVLPGRGRHHGDGSLDRAGDRAFGFKRAAMRTSRTSGSSPRPNATWSSTSTTSTRPCPAPGSGTSSASPASLHVVARQRGFSRASCDRVVTTAVRGYRKRMAQIRDDAVARALVRANRHQRRHRALSREVPAASATRRRKGAAKGSPARRSPS